MTNMRIRFKILDHKKDVPVGSKCIPYQIIFDAKFDLTQKVKLVIGGHRHKDVPSHITFSTVASRDIIRLSFHTAALNNLKIITGEICAYLNTPNKERVHVILGPELFGPDNAG